MEDPNAASKRKFHEIVSPSSPSTASSNGFNAVEVVDLKTLKELVFSFERRLKDNIEVALKYPNQPDRLADSEVELHHELQKLKVLAGATELYPDLINLNVVPSIVYLLNHNNSKIAIDIVLLLQDLTDEDVLGDNHEPAKVLVENLVENRVLESLVHNLHRLSDSMAAVYYTLATIENFIQVKPAVAELICEKTKLLKWLVGKLRVRGELEEYAVEILSILLLNTANQKRLGEMDGVDIILEGIATYKSKDPKGFSEEEMMENLFDCLCCLLMEFENKKRFLKVGGVELIIIIMKEENLAYGAAIRVLDFATTNYPTACEHLVDILALDTVFVAFMTKASVKTFL